MSSELVIFADELSRLGYSPVMFNQLIPSQQRALAYKVFMNRNTAIDGAVAMGIFMNNPAYSWYKIVTRYQDPNSIAQKVNSPRAAG